MDIYKELYRTKIHKNIVILLFQWATYSKSGIYTRRNSYMERSLQKSD